MRNPIYNKQHLIEYFLYGLLAACAYTIPVLYFLYDNKYENFYYVYLGNLLFMFAILFHVVRLIYRPYEGKRAVSMMVAGTLTTVTGIILSCILVLISMVFFFPDLFSSMSSHKAVENAPEPFKTNSPGQLFFMLLINTIIANFGVGVFISVITAYAGKKDQRKDKPESLDVHIPKTGVKVQ